MRWKKGTENWTDLLNGFYDTSRKNWWSRARTWKTSSGWSSRPTRSVEVRQPAGVEVGQVRHLLCLLEVLQEEAGDGGQFRVEEGREGGDEEDHQGSCSFR